MAPTSKRGHGKPADKPARQGVEEQVLPKEFAYTLSGGEKVTLRKLSMRQVKELALDLSLVHNEDGSINGAEVSRLAMAKATEIASAATGLSMAETDKLPADDVIGMAGKVLISMSLENAAVMSFFAHVGIILSMARGEVPAALRQDIAT